MNLFKKNEVDMLSGPIVKGLLAIALPIMIMNVTQSLFGIIDMTILKMYDTGDGYAVGAVGASGTLITLITALLIGVSSGANVVIARYIGQGDRDRVERAIGCSVLFSVAGGFTLLAIGVSLADVFLSLTNCPDELMSEATLYFRLYFVGVPILMLYNFCASILRSTGDSRRPMIYLTLGGILKILFTYVFVAHFKMQVAGVAIATIISWLTSAVLAMRALIKNDGVAHIKLERLRFYKQELREMLIIGIPAGLQHALYSIANVIITATVNSFGPDAATGISIANNFDGILYQVAVAPSLAVMPYVSQNVGRGNIKRAARSVSKGIMITVLLGATLGALSAIFSTELSSLMSDSPAVIAYSKQKMIIISSTYFICGINEIMGASLRGMGRPVIATVATLIYMCAFRFVWVYLIFPLCPNMTFLYLVWPIGWTLSILTLLCYFFPTIKRLKAQAQLK